MGIRVLRISCRRRIDPHLISDRYHRRITKGYQGWESRLTIQQEFKKAIGYSDGLRLYKIAVSRFYFILVKTISIVFISLPSTIAYISIF